MVVAVRSARLRARPQTGCGFSAVGRRAGRMRPRPRGVTLAWMSTESEASVDLYWLPLGAGGHSVRLNGRLFEALVARLEKRPTRALYHSALIVRVPEGTFAIEMAPIPDGNGKLRGVVSERPRRQPLGSTLADLPLRESALPGGGVPRNRRGRRPPNR